MSQINIRNLSNENDDGSPEIVGVSTFSATSFFVPPKGSTAERPSDCEPGSIRFNTDTANLEYFRGKTLGWSQFDLVTPNLGGGTGSNTGLGARGVMIGGHSHPSYYNTIDFVTISTLGNAQDFGDATINVSQVQGCASRTRGFSAGSWQPSVTDTIQFITISSTGNGSDFGNLTESTRLNGALSDSTRAVRVAGANTPTNTNTIDYWTMSQTGNAVDFGDITTANSHWCTCVSSSTRGVWVSGLESNNIMEFITIATTGNSVDFGDSTQNVGGQPHGGGNSTRGIFAGGGTPSSPNATNTIEFITIATLGNAIDFGDTTITRRYNPSGPSDPVRMLMTGGGSSDTSPVNTIDFITITTTGDAADFGDLTSARTGVAGSSNAHGGL